MTQISLSELIDVLKRDPGYRQRWQLEVPAEQALYISFGEHGRDGLESVVLEVIDGHELVIDKDKEGRVCGIELV